MDGSTPQIRVDEVIAKYISLRDQKDTIAAQAKAQTQEIDKQLDLIGAWLLNEANTQGVTSLACDIGTAFVKETDFAGVQNWDQTLDFIRANGMWQMLKKDVAKGAVKEFIEANGVPPPGVNWGSKKEIQVRRKS